MQYQNLIRLFLAAIFVMNLSAMAATSNTQDTAKAALIKTMYEQDVKNEGSAAPILAKFANPKLTAALKLEQDYFDKNQEICGADVDVIWDSQDPDYVMPKLSAENGKIKAHLNQGSDVYFDVDCSGNTCKISDVTLDGVGSLKAHLIKNCK